MRVSIYINAQHPFQKAGFHNTAKPDNTQNIHFANLITEQNGIIEYFMTATAVTIQVLIEHLHQVYNTDTLESR